MGLTGEGEGAGAGDGGQWVGGHALVQPGVLLGGLHDHQQLAPVGTGDHVHPGVDLQRLLIWVTEHKKGEKQQLKIETAIEKRQQLSFSPVILFM